MAKNDGGAFSWFLAGLGLGSLLGVLYAPRAGQETREELVSSALGSGEYVRQRSRDVQQQAGEYVERGKTQVNEYVGRGKEQASQYAGAGKEQVGGALARGREVVEVGRRKVNEVVGQGTGAVVEQKEKLAAAYEAGRQAYLETSVPTKQEAKQESELIPSGTTEKS